jgi:hypothetical protein
LDGGGASGVVLVGNENGALSVAAGVTEMEGVIRENFSEGAEVSLPVAVVGGVDVADGVENENGNGFDGVSTGFSEVLDEVAANIPEAVKDGSAIVVVLVVATALDLSPFAPSSLGAGLGDPPRLLLPNNDFFPTNPCSTKSPLFSFALRFHLDENPGRTALAGEFNPCRP